MTELLLGVLLCLGDLSCLYCCYLRGDICVLLVHTGIHEGKIKHVPSNQDIFNTVKMKVKTFSTTNLAAVEEAALAESSITLSSPHQLPTVVSSVVHCQSSSSVFDETTVSDDDSGQVAVGSVSSLRQCQTSDSTTSAAVNHSQVTIVSSSSTFSQSAAQWTSSDGGCSSSAVSEIMSASNGSICPVTS